ncbi:unnamed protein product [Rhizoctonia solani]|uniref:Endo-1,5-alpha-L-arabinanase A n=1 Tax=Rhizoctonia solani TaxID=456999 RepID=A0A8H3HRS0_9AGAM|nr:unnamed protein product [Rhizoctonia solani]
MVFLVVNPSHEDERPARDTNTRRQPSPLPRASRVSPRTHTVNIPLDVIRLVILQVTRIPDLASFALTSRYFNNIATPLLYSALSFGPAAYRRYKLSGHSRGAGGHEYVSVSAESPMGRGEEGCEDNFFDNRSSLCVELLSRSPHLLPYVRSISTNLTVPNYAAAVRAARGQRTGEETTFHEWVAILTLPQASSVRHLALGNVNDQHLLTLSTARHLKLTALELNVPPAALPELSCLSNFLQRQRHITHFASRNLDDIKGMKDYHLPRLTHVEASAALVCQIAPGRPITTARVFPFFLATQRGSGLRSADELLMAIHALAQSTDSVGVTDLDVSVLWYGDHRMGDDCRAFFAAIRDSLPHLRHLSITLWSELAPNNVDILFDCILSTLPSLQSLETFKIKTWAEYGISHPSHLPHSTRRAIFELWKEICPSLSKVAALENHTWTWHAARVPTRHPTPARSNSDPYTKVPARRPLPPRPRPASGNWSGYYYVFSTHGGVARSKALRGPWTAIGSYLPTGCSVITANAGHCDTWAPDVVNINGTYFVYYSISQFGTQNSVIGVATSKTMEYGTWTDHGAVFSSKAGDQYNSIDANVINANGKLLFTFGSYWADIFQFELAPSGLAPLSPSAPQLTHLVLNQTSPQSAEGGFIYKPPKSKFYYLFYSSGTCCAFHPAALPAPGDEYKVFVGRSESGSGPFVGATGKPLTETGGTLVLASHDNIYAPGGNSVFWDPKSKRDVIAYHYRPRNDIRGDANSLLGLNYLDFSSGWPVLVA